MIFINGKFLGQRLTGVQRFADEITAELIKINPSIKIIVPESYKDRIINKYENNTIYVGKTQGIIWEQITLPYFAKKSDALLLNFCNSAPLFLRNKLTCVHDMSYKANPEWFSKKFIAYYSVLIPRILRTSKYIITVSSFSKSEILKYLPTLDDSKISVVSNACSNIFINDIFPDEKRDDIKQFLFVGSVEPRKNLQRLIEAFTSIKDNDIRLIIVGATNNKSFKTTGTEYMDPRIIWMTNCSDKILKSLYLESIALINPSFYEGFGVPLIEAANSGTLLIVSDIPAFREIAKQDAFYINPMDLNSIKERLEMVIQMNKQERNNISQKAYSRIKNEFSWKISAENINRIITKQ